MAATLDVAGGVILGGIVLFLLKEGAFGLASRDPLLGPQKRGMGLILFGIGAISAVAIFWSHLL